MKLRYALACLFLAACGSTVTQDSPQDPTSIQDAGTDADAATPDAGNLIIGRPCQTDEDCVENQMRCDLTGPGGYCTYMCGGDILCPDGSICAPMPLSRISGLCMQSCTNTSECRAGYVCDVVYLFPGDPSSPVSPSPVCWVPPPNP